MSRYVQDMPGQTNPTPAQLVYVSDLHFLEHLARSYKKDALIIKGGDYSGCTPTFHLLASLAIELFPKVLLGNKICASLAGDPTQTQESIKKAVSDELVKHRHKIDVLYNRFPKLLAHLGVSRVEEFSNNFVWEYRFHRTYSQSPLSIKHIEAIRYGSFAQNPDIATICVHDHLLVGLLDLIEEFVQSDSSNTAQLLGFPR